MNMKEKLLNMGYKVWTKKEGEERIYVNNLLQFLTVTKTEKSVKDEIDVYEDTIENIDLKHINKSTAREIKHTLENNEAKFYYDVQKNKFFWKYKIKEIDELMKCVVENLRNSTINTNTKKVNNNVFVSATYYEKDAIVKYNNEYVKIASVESIELSKDEVEAVYGGCFADNEENYNIYKNSYRYTYIEANEIEKENKQAIDNKKQEETEKKHLLLEEKRNAERALCEYIRSNCKQEDRSEQLEENISKSVLICELDNLNSIKINTSLNVIYLLTKNWSDYDCWDYNNCNIGICKTCTKTTELQSLLDNYLKSCEVAIC